MKKELVLKILKIALMVIALLCFIGLMFFFIRGIHKSLFENDIKTAQNRINSAYQFLIMLIFGLCLIASLIGVYNIKIQILPDKLSMFFGYKKKEEISESEEELEAENIEEAEKEETKEIEEEEIKEEENKEGE